MLKFVYNGWFFIWKIIFCIEIFVFVKLFFIIFVLYFNRGVNMVLDISVCYCVYISIFVEYLLLLLVWVGGE